MLGRTNTGGSGGGGLNFKVVAYATEEELTSATPKENSIGVITSNKITSWVFSATVPEDPEEGMVWFVTGTYPSGEFNALKKNGIMVYPQSATQFVGGEWEEKTGKTYKGGKWSDWMVYLYDHGDTCDDVTGGWTAEAWKYASSTNAATPTLTLNSDHLYAKGGAGGGVVRCINKIDLTGYSKLIFDGILYNTSGTNEYTQVGIWSEKTAWVQHYIALAGHSTVAGVDDIVEIDISSISGSYYVGIGLYYNNGSAVKMRGMRLE